MKVAMAERKTLVTVQTRCPECAEMQVFHVPVEAYANGDTIDVPFEFECINQHKILASLKRNAAGAWSVEAKASVYRRHG
jgi:hypothetical protein